MIVVTDTESEDIDGAPPTDAPPASLAATTSTRASAPSRSLCHVPKNMSQHQRALKRSRDEEGGHDAGAPTGATPGTAETGPEPVSISLQDDEDDNIVEVGHTVTAHPPHRADPEAVTNDTHPSTAQHHAAAAILDDSDNDMTTPRRVPATVLDDSDDGHMDTTDGRQRVQMLDSDTGEDFNGDGLGAEAEAFADELLPDAGEDDSGSEANEDDADMEALSDLFDDPAELKRCALKPCIHRGTTTIVRCLCVVLVPGEQMFCGQAMCGVVGKCYQAGVGNAAYYRALPSYHTIERYFHTIFSAT